MIDTYQPAHILLHFTPFNAHTHTAKNNRQQMQSMFLFFLFLFLKGNGLYTRRGGASLGRDGLDGWTGWMRACWDSVAHWRNTIHWPLPVMTGWRGVLVYTTFRMNAIQKAINTTFVVLLTAESKNLDALGQRMEAAKSPPFKLVCICYSYNISEGLYSPLFRETTR